jgi:sarcosine oxidase subunit alpha
LRKAILKIRINGTVREAASGSIVAAVLLASDTRGFRRSVTGEDRGPLCGMGVCFECRATVDGIPNTRTCTLPVADGMEIRID